MSDPRLVVSAGYMPLDIINQGTEAWHRAGGTAGNVAAILALLGWSAVLAGRIGDDAAGRALLADLKRASVNTSLVDVERGAPTNRLVHEVRPGGHRYVFTCPHCGQALPRSRPLRLCQVDGIVAALPRPEVYFFDRVNPATLLLAERYAEAGATVVFEPSTPANAALLQRAMQAAAIVKGSQEHGPDLVESYEGGRPNQLRVITHGVRGAKVRIGSGRWHRVGVFPAEVVDAAGAGDWTTAGMLHKIVGPSPPGVDEVKDGIVYGHALAALNCAVPGARGLAEGRDRHAIQRMVSALRSGQHAVPTNAMPAGGRPAAGLCRWCLLDLDAGADAAAARR